MVKSTMTGMVPFSLHYLHKTRENPTFDAKYLNMTCDISITTAQNVQCSHQNINQPSDTARTLTSIP